MDDGEGDQGSEDEGERPGHAEEAYEPGVLFFDVFEEVAFARDLDQACPDPGGEQDACPSQECGCMDEGDEEGGQSHDYESGYQNFLLTYLLVAQKSDRQLEEEEWQQHDGEYEPYLVPPHEQFLA